jgi:hypothetical protein
VTLVSSMQYVKTLLDDLSWPASMQALPNPPGNLIAHITAPNPNVTASAPNAYIWFARGTENRNNAKYGAGTIPRALYEGAPSGTKAVEHNIPVYVVWDAQQGDPNFSTLFPGMVDAIRATLRVSEDPALITDPWTGEESWLVDVGETISYDLELMALDGQRLERWDVMLTCTVTEVIFS